MTALSQQIKGQINERLIQAEALIDPNASANDYPSVKEKVLQLELLQEITALRALLEEDFEQAFRSRCIERQANRDIFFPFSELPESSTNTLYWDIATLVFHPQTLGEMLAILLPGISKQLIAAIPDSFPAELMPQPGRLNTKEFKEYLRNIPPYLVEEDIHSLQGEPTLANFSHCVITENCLFDVRQMAFFSLGSHVQFKQLLDLSYFDLQQKLYQHNTFLQTLVEDIATFEQKGTPPKRAIEQLIRDLILAGTRMSAGEFANAKATNAVSRFLCYLEALPLEMQTALCALKANNFTLEDIIKNQLKKVDSCIEIAAGDLQALLAQNKECALLTMPPQLGKDALRQLENKYLVQQDDTVAEIFPTKKDPFNQITLPEQLLHQALTSIAPETPEELVTLLLGFPPTFYKAFWEQIEFTNPKDTLEDLAETIMQGFFNPEQKQALTKAIIANYARLCPRDSLLHWACLTSEQTIIKEVINGIPEGQRLAAVKVANEDGDTVLHYAAHNFESLKVILELLPEGQRLEAVKFADNNGNTVLDYTADKLESLKAVLELFPEGQRLAAVKLPDKYGNTVLHYAADKVESLKALLALYPEGQRLAAVKLADNYGDTVLHKAAHNFESLKAVLELLPEGQRLEAVKFANNNGNTVLHYAADNVESLKAVLALLPEGQRLEVVKLANNYGDTVLDKAAARIFKSDFSAFARNAKA